MTDVTSGARTAAPRFHNRSLLGTRLGTTLPAALAILLLVPVIFLPLVFLVYGSTLSTESAVESGSVTFQHFVSIAQNASHRSSLLNSLKLALATGVGAGIVGVTIAWIVVHVRPPFWRVVDTLMVVPFFLSPFVVAIAWTFLGNPSNGMINKWISGLIGIDVAPISVYSFWGIAFVMVTSTSPFVYMLVSAALAGSDPSLEEAAAMNGANRWRRLTTVTLPLVAPSILAGVFFAVVFALESFAEPAILGAAIRYNTVMTDVYFAIQGFPSKYGTASALAVVIMAITMLLVYFQSRLLGERSFVSLSGKSGSSADVSRGYGPTARYSLMLVPILYLIIAVGLPYFVLVLVSLQPFASPQITNLSFANYRAFLGDPETVRSFQNSALAALGGVVVSAVWMFILAYVLRKARFPGSKLIGHLAMLPIAVPGVVMGVALLWMWLRSPVPLYGTLLLISLAYVARFSPFVLRTVSAAMTQIDVGLEESARMSGAGSFQVLRDVVFPLTRPSLLSGAIIFSLFALRDLNSVILLSGLNNTTLSVQIWSLYENSQLPRVAAASVIQSLILLALLSLARWVARSGTRHNSSERDETNAAELPKVAAATP